MGADLHLVRAGGKGDCGVVTVFAAGSGPGQGLTVDGDRGGERRAVDGLGEEDFDAGESRDDALDFGRGGVEENRGAAGPGEGSRHRGRERVGEVVLDAGRVEGQGHAGAAGNRIVEGQYPGAAALASGDLALRQRRVRARFSVEGCEVEPPPEAVRRRRETSAGGSP